MGYYWYMMFICQSEWDINGNGIFNGIFLGSFRLKNVEYLYEQHIYTHIMTMNSFGSRNSPIPSGCVSENRTCIPRGHSLGRMMFPTQGITGLIPRLKHHSQNNSKWTPGKRQCDGPPWRSRIFQRNPLSYPHGRNHLVTIPMKSQALRPGDVVYSHYASGKVPV